MSQEKFETLSRIIKYNNCIKHCYSSEGDKKCFKCEKECHRVREYDTNSRYQTSINLCGKCGIELDIYVEEYIKVVSDLVIDYMCHDLVNELSEYLRYN